MQQNLPYCIVAIALVGQLVTSLTLTTGHRAKSYVAAVYEHQVILPQATETPVTRTKALELMNENLAIYEEQAELAKSQAAEILVFPEDGIYGMYFNRKTVFPYLESIPDPENVTWSPCSDPKRFPNTEVQHSLSCMALKNSIYIVANIGDKVYCNKENDPKCPKDGRYQYNTAVAYDPKGNLVAKYHKRHLYFEDQFDTPVAKAKYFDTPFGRFGLAVCFDLLFYDPAVALVTQHNVTNILFPTAWMDALPLLSAIGFHSSFARGLGVNLLAANIHRPSARFQGSGIYIPTGVADFYYERSLSFGGKLLVSKIDVPRQTYNGNDVNSIGNTVKNLIPMMTDKIYIDKTKEFLSNVSKDLFTFRALESSEGEIRVCVGGVCCFLKYGMDENSMIKDLFAFGAFDGRHHGNQYHYQACALLRCKDREDKSSCGEYTFKSSTKFKFLHVEGHFGSEFVFPQVILSNNGQLELAKSLDWSFHSTTFHGKHASAINASGLIKPVVLSSLFARIYSEMKQE